MPSMANMLSAVVVVFAVTFLVVGITLGINELRPGYGAPFHLVCAIVAIIWTRASKFGDILGCVLLWPLMVGAVVALKLGLSLRLLAAHTNTH